MAGVAAVSPKFYFPGAEGGAVDTYIAGTTTRTTTWQDRALSTANENPVELNARAECVLWLDPALSYKFVVKDADGVTLYTVDNVTGADPDASAGATFTVDRFSGDGSDTTFTLSVTPDSENLVDVFVSGVYQQKNTFSLAGDVLTFAVAPASGTNNIEVVTRQLLDSSALATAMGVLRSQTEADALATAGDRAQTAEDRIATAADRVQTGQDRAAAAASAAAAALSEEGAAQVAIGLYTASAAGAEPRSFLDKARDQWVSLADFTGADPTGTTSSVTALQNALNTGKDVIVVGGTWLLDGAITAANNGSQRVIGICGATFSVDLAASTDLFTINGPLGFEKIVFDFNNGPCRYALRYAASVGHIVLRDLEFNNLKDDTSTTEHITILIPPTGNTFDIQGIRASSLYKRGNGVIGDTGGNLNVIYIGGGTGGTQGSIRDVYASEIHNIDNTDAVIYEDTAVIYMLTDDTDTDNRITVDNVRGYNFGKRLLKFQASNVSVSNVTGYSIEGDSLGVCGFFNDGAGDMKYGCSGTNMRAFGKMEDAFSASASGAKWRNLYAVVEPGTKTGMSNAGNGLLINGDDTEVDGYFSSSERLLTIGSSLQVIKNTKLRNLQLHVTTDVFAGLQNVSNTLGFDGLLIDGCKVKCDAGTTLRALAGDLYLNGTTKIGRNLSLKNIEFESAGDANAYGIYFKYCTNVSLQNYRYKNTSANTHYRLAIFESCENVHVDDVVVEGANTIGVILQTCTGRNTVNRVQNTGATTAAVYNQNSTDVRVNDCDPAKVTGITTNLALNGTLLGSKTQDWADLATATQQSTTVTVTGAAVGDSVVGVSMSTALSGTRLWGEVTAADTVTVYHRNDTGGNVNVASGTLRVWVREA